MEVKNIELSSATIRLNEDELIIINNALNEVCNALDNAEFFTRMGANEQEVEGLLDDIGKVIDSIRNSS